MANCASDYCGGESGCGATDFTAIGLCGAFAYVSLMVRLYAWLCSVATLLYLPLYVVAKVVAGGPRKAAGVTAALRNGVQNFRERGFTPCESVRRFLASRRPEVYSHILKVFVCQTAKL